MSLHMLPVCAPAGRLVQVHGSHYSCRLLVAASRARRVGDDYALRRHILQKWWRMTCDHIPEVPHIAVTPEPPPHDSPDPLQVLLIANSDLPSG